MEFKFPPKEALAVVPTPIHELPRLSEALNGPRIFVKRDDLTGCELTGNKVRKAEYLLAEARSKKAQVVLTCGGVQSNHARTIAIAAARLGMKTHLFRRNDGLSSLDGNLFLDHLVDAEIQYLNHEEYEKVDELMLEQKKRYEEKGTRAYVIPEGGSNELGAVAYMEAMAELKHQMQEQNLSLDVLICAVGSGGTYTGLLLGQYLFDVNIQIWGLNICETAEYFNKVVRKLLKKCRRRFGLPKEVEELDIHIIDGCVGKGYGLNRKEEIEHIKEVARLEGLILDPVYTGKAMYCVKDLILQGRLHKGQNLLFLHTGGIFGLFPKRNLFF